MLKILGKSNQIFLFILQIDKTLCPGFSKFTLPDLSPSHSPVLWPKRNTTKILCRTVKECAGPRGHEIRGHLAKQFTGRWSLVMASGISDKHKTLKAKPCTAWILKASPKRTSLPGKDGQVLQRTYKTVTPPTEPQLPMVSVQTGVMTSLSLWREVWEPWRLLINEASKFQFLPKFSVLHIPKI